MPPEIEFHIKPQGKVLDAYYRSRARVSFIMGPLGSAKTYQSCLKALALMMEQEPNAQNIRKTRFYAVRNTYSDLLTTTIKDWLEILGDLGHYKGPGAEPPTHTIRFEMDDGTQVYSEMVFLALDRPDDVKKLRGAQATWFWLNEIKELPKAVIDMADLRHGRYPSATEGGPTQHGMFGDTNAPDDDHWYYRLAEEELPEGWEFFRQPGGVIKRGEVWVQNPDAENLANLPDGYYTKGMAGKSDDWISVNLGNEYGTVQDGKPIYPEYSDSIHCAKGSLMPYRGLPLILSWDFGLTPSCIISQISPRGQFRVLKELVSESMGIKQFSQKIVKPYLANHFNGMETVGAGDPAGVARAQTDERTCFEVLKSVGLEAEPSDTNNFTARREAVAGYLTQLVDGKPAFLLDPSCKMLRKGFRGQYRYRRLLVPGEERYTEKPDKNAVSHPHDALQYGCQKAAGPMQKKKKRRARKATYRPASSAGY